MEAYAMDMNSKKRVQLLFLDKSEGPLFLTSEPRTASLDRVATKPTETPPPLSTIIRSSSTASSSSSTGSSCKNSRSSFGRKDSTSTRASSISIPPWRPPPTFVQQFMAAPPYIYGYDLPCEFFFLGCNIRFNPAEEEAWISHSVSHFVNNPLPAIAICTFCDEATFRSHGDAATNWRDRMLHIHEHLEDFTPSEHMRPDFWVIEHMQAYGLISPEDHAYALQGTERPYCDHTYPPDYETPEMKTRKERALQQPHNLGNEDRQRKREGNKGKSSHKSSHSHRPSKSNKVRIE